MTKNDHLASNHLHIKKLQQKPDNLTVVGGEFVQHTDSVQNPIIFWDLIQMFIRQFWGL